jgi:hypothetical protein
VSRSANRRWSQKCLDPLELPNSLCDLRRTLTKRIVLVQNVSVLFVPFTLDARQAALRSPRGVNILLTSENKSRQLLRKGTINGRRLNQIYQFLADDIIEGRLEAKTSSDRFSCLALRDPDFVRFAEIIVPPFYDRRLRTSSMPATRPVSTNAADPRRCAPRWRWPSSVQPERQAACRG